MTHPALPTPVAAPPRRHPLRAWRVRWTRPAWSLDRYGCVRWHSRWYVQRDAALRLVRHLRDSGAEVELDTFALVHDASVTWPDEEDPSA